MDSKLRKKLEARAAIVKALAHPTRLFIVDELSRGSRCVCELTEMIGDDISTVSRHLAILKEAGIVKATRHGTQMICELKCSCILNFFTCVENVLAGNLQESREQQ